MRGGRNMPEFNDFDGNKDGYISEQGLKLASKKFNPTPNIKQTG